MISRLLTLVATLSLFMGAAGGCGGSRPGAAPIDVPAMAGWKPDYQNIIEETGVSHDYQYEVKINLLGRTSIPAFLELCHAIRWHAGRADYLLLAERCDQAGYGFGLVVVEGDRAFRYSSDSRWFFSNVGNASSPVGWQVRGSADVAAARNLFAMLKAGDAWRADARRGFAEGRTHPSPTFIHLYGRREGAVSFMNDNPSPDVAEAVVGNKPLKPIRRQPRPSTSPSDAWNPGDDDPSRLAYEGLMRLLYARQGT